MNRKMLGRALVGAILFLSLGGPAPGAVGSCGGSTTAADAHQFCIDWRITRCNRAKARGEVPPTPPPPCVDDPATPANEADPAMCNLLFCQSQVPESCLHFVWPADCVPEPTTLMVTACYLGLHDPARLADVPADNIWECQMATLCPSSGTPLTEALDEAPYDPEPPTVSPASASEVP